MKRPVNLLLVLCPVYPVIWGLGAPFVQVRGRARLAQVEDRRAETDRIWRQRLERADFAPNRSRSVVNSPAESAGSRTASARIARTSASIDLP
jgi:hypothetical protein